MRVVTICVRFLCLSLAIIATSAGQRPPARDQQSIRVGVELITTDVRVRERTGRFVSNLGKTDFEVYEDGVKQELVSFLMSLGGRIYNVAAPSPAPSPEGVVLPPAKPIDADAGRVFVIFVDDQHLDPAQTIRVKQLLKDVAATLVHEGDLYAAVSTGPSSIEIPLTYDRKRLDGAIARVMGNGLTPNEIIEAPRSAQGNAELRHRAHVAFRTAWDLMENLEQVQHRRKAIVYISNGYDFAPFEKMRAKLEAERLGCGGEIKDEAAFAREGTQFSEADLVIDLAELTRAANRASATIYPIDPRGLSAGPDLSQRIDPVEWQDHLSSTQNSLRTLADLTGGFATVNRNDLAGALKRIDHETSDYYLIGYYSSNIDRTERRRTIEVRVKRPDVDVHHRKEYVLRR